MVDFLFQNEKVEKKWNTNGRNDNWKNGEETRGSSGGEMKGKMTVKMEQIFEVISLIFFFFKKKIATRKRARENNCPNTVAAPSLTSLLCKFSGKMNRKVENWAAISLLAQKKNPFNFLAKSPPKNWIIPAVKKY